MKHFFGFEKVDKKTKDHKVQEVFSRVSNKYDLMNDLMSLGMHRIWKRKLLSHLYPKHQKVLLDLAGGTGDIASSFIKGGGKKAIIFDINREMLKHAEKKIINHNFNIYKKLEFIEGNANKLPFKENTFDYITLAFGLRNMSEYEKTLKEIYRIRKVDGIFICMEFNPKLNNKLLQKLYDFYAFNIIPKMGKVILNDADSYRYLSESIRTFMPQDKLIELMKKTGFKDVIVEEMFFGIVNQYICSLPS